MLLKIIILVELSLLSTATIVCEKNGTNLEVELSTLNIQNCSNNVLDLGSKREEIIILNAENNLIHGIQNWNLEKASSLKSINLTSNKIQEISCQAFVDQKVLSHLYLGYNLLKDLIPGVFDSLVELKILHLDINKLTVLEHDLFRKNLNLSYISVIQNNILAIDPDLFNYVETFNYTFYFYKNPCAEKVSSKKCIQNYKKDYQKNKRKYYCHPKNDDCTLPFYCYLAIPLIITLIIFVVCLMCCIISWKSTKIERKSESPIYYDLPKHGPIGKMFLNRKQKQESGYLDMGANQKWTKNESHDS